MARHICVLNSGEEGPHLADFLRQQRTGLVVSVARTLEELDAIVSDQDGKVRLISIVSDVIVPKRILDQLVVTPYNIHPGPPAYPGYNPECWAIWEQAAEFGVTAHVMVTKVDAGAIVAVSRFAMPDHPERLSLNEFTLAQAIKVFALVGAHCASSDADMPHMDESWRTPKRTRKDFAELCSMTEGLSAGDVIRLKAACGPDYAGPIV